MSESRSHAAHLQPSNNRQPEWSWPPWKSWPGPILSCCRQKTNMHKVWMAGIAQWLEQRTPDWKVVGSNPCWSGGRIFLSGVNFLCWLLFWCALGLCSSVNMPSEKVLAGTAIPGGGRGSKYLSLHCHHLDDSCIKMGSDERHLMFC